MTETEGECGSNNLGIFTEFVSNIYQFSEFNQLKPGKTSKQHNILPIWGNEQTMNLNPLILANIQGSSYFKGR